MVADLGIGAQRTMLWEERRRWWSTLTAVAVIAFILGLRPVAAQTCVGDCKGEGKVNINDLILGVNIALGLQPVTACEAFANQDGNVNIAQIIQGVNDALNGCPGPPVTVTGSCAEPGPGNHGLKPCDAETPITVFRCDDRTQCLHEQGLTMVGATTVASDGGWSVQIPMIDASATLIFQASITQAVVYRTLGFGLVGGSFRAGLARDMTFAPVDITPVTEAAVQLLYNNGFANYSDTGAQKVVTAVEQATANLMFDGDTPETAVAQALQTASDNPVVMMVLQTARNTPTATVTTTSPPTKTATPPPTSTNTPVANTFRPLAATMTSGRSGHTATLLPDGQVVLIGGEDLCCGNGTTFDTAERYNPVTNSFTALAATMTSARSNHTATLLPNGRVLLTGGSNHSGNALDSAELYDPTADTFTALAAKMTSGRTGHRATLLPNGQVLLTGGFNTSGTAVNTAEVYDPVANAFTALTHKMTSARALHAAILLPDDQVFITGGGRGPESSAATILNTAELYNPVANTFTALAPTMTSARAFHTATLLSNDQVLITGGISSTSGPALDTAEVYAP